MWHLHWAKVNLTQHEKATMQQSAGSDGDADFMETALRRNGDGVAEQPTARNGSKIRKLFEKRQSSSGESKQAQ